MFTGEYRYKIDVKKRLAMPAKFRGELGVRVIITKGITKCLVVYTKKSWQDMLKKLGGLPITEPEARGFARVILAGAMEVSFDKLGRILIPDYLKKYAGLEKEVVICGLNKELEVWDAKRWNSYITKQDENMNKSEKAK
ncbi:division/cell wall cluster transcriptional repressor MraZ [Patescibacteria group bacterium]|nr:division/cell wall cluster transcriptional repressor MraZ [Patescibacteria group bacterium]